MFSRKLHNSYGHFKKKKNACEQIEKKNLKRSLMQYSSIASERKFLYLIPKKTRNNVKQNISIMHFYSFKLRK